MCYNMTMIAIARKKNQISITKLDYQCYNYLHEHDFVRVKKRRGEGEGKVALTEIREFVQCITCKSSYCESCGKMLQHSREPY